jgi:23S rRNA pseudouridine2605 synthase
MNEEDEADSPDAARGERIAPEARGERIAKWLARAGVASRRDAEKLIADGKVKLNGKTVETPATFVAAGDRVLVDGKPIATPERTRLFRYHKPDGLVTTHRDPQGRATVFEKLPPGMPRVVSIGRLDITSEGLLLLTNDGELARKLELPSHGWLRRYRVRVHGPVDERALARLARGITVEGVAYGPIEAGLDSRQGANSWLTISLKEGKNREVRRVMAHLGLQVTRLIRVAYGPFQLGVLPRGGVEEVHPRILREQLGIGEKPARKRAAEAPASSEPKRPTPTPPRGRSIPRARNAEPRRPGRATRHRRPPSRP